MAILKHILQYSNDGVTVEKELVLNQDEDCLEGLLEIIKYEYDNQKFYKCESGYLGDWCKVEVEKYPYNRLFLKIEED